MKRSTKPAAEGKETLHFTRESEATEAFERWSTPWGSKQVVNEMEYNKDGTFTVRREWKKN